MAYERVHSHEIQSLSRPKLTRGEGQDQSAADPRATPPTRAGTLGRIARYSITRIIVLLIAVVVAVYLTIIIANMGGFVDEIIRTHIDLALMGQVQAGWLRDLPLEEKVQTIEQVRAAMEEAEGLNEPFLLRTFGWLWKGLTLDWGEAEGSRYTIGGQVSMEVRDVILDHLPRTMLIFGAANVLLFISSVLLALALSRKHGSWLDKAVVGLSPMGAAPAWAYGIILNLIALKLLGTSVGGTFDAWPDEFRLAYVPMIMRYMVLPFLAIFASGFFQSVYTWRALFMLYSAEDYVEMAKAKGLSARTIERSYIMRPGMPAVLTSFALILVVLWQEVIALEKFFDVAGIGRLLYYSLRSLDLPVVLGLVVGFAYLLAITVFILELMYVLIDPRVGAGTDGQTVRPAVRRRTTRFWRKREPRPVALGFGNPGPGPNTANKAERSTPSTRGLAGGRRIHWPNLVPTMREVARYPSAVLGLAIIAALLGVSVITVATIPYHEAVALWRGDDSVWYRNPIKAPPAWVNYLRRDKLPESIVLDTRVRAVDGAGAWSKSTAVASEGVAEITVRFIFDYPYDAFPQDMALRFNARFASKKPLLTLTWRTPDGREIDMGSFTITTSQAYYLAQDERLRRRGGGMPLQEALFADPVAQTRVALPGTYEVEVNALVFEYDADLDAEFVLYGQVYGLAGTDHKRRDLMVALLWGMPVALAFGLTAAVGTSLATMAFAAIGVWYGGWVDGLVQRITEVNLILPFLPISIMIYTLYSKSFLAILGVTVLLSIFGSGIKNYRAIFLQLKQAPYIEAAQAYGASDWRIILRYLVPRVGAVMIPQLVILIPGYVFLEATLAFLELTDPVLPTWGKLIVDALSQGTYSGDYHMLLEPTALLMATGFAFAMVGFALERILDPRLRER